MKRPWLFISGPAYGGRPICREIGSADFTHSVTAPTTLVSMATVAREIGGIRPLVFDLQAHRQGLGRLADLIREHRPVAIVQVIAEAVRVHDLQIFKLARQLDPTIATICLPVPPAYAEAIVSAHPEVDIALYSGDEVPMGPLAAAIDAAGGLAGADLAGIAGIVWREAQPESSGESRRVVKNAPCAFAYPGLYGSLAHPDFELLDYPLSRYDKVVTYWTRGCPSLCSFCTDRRTVRTARPVAHMVAELENLERIHGVFYVDFYDRNFLIRLDEVRELCDEIARRKLAIGWTAFCRLNRIDPDLALSMSRGGCRLLCVGLESASNRVLRDIKKGTNMSVARQSLANIQKSGIRLALYLIFGLPEEDAESIRETVAFIKEVGPDFCVPSTATPYPETELMEVVERENLWARDPSSGPEYSLKLGDVKIRTRHLSAEELARLRDEALAELRRWRWHPLTLARLARRTSRTELGLLLRPTSLSKAARRILPYFTRRSF